MVNEEEEFLRWWWEQLNTFPEEIRVTHLAQAAYAAWCARAKVVPVHPADLTITNLDLV